MKLLPEQQRLNSHCQSDNIRGPRRSCEAFAGWHVRCNRTSLEFGTGSLVCGSWLRLTRNADSRVDPAIEADLGITTSLLGDPSAILQRLAALEAAGVDTMMMKFGPSDEAERFARLVVEPYRAAVSGERSDVAKNETGPTL